jgi:serine/threonine protein kinase
MDTAKVCQHCGKPLGAKAVQGLCPECFMKVGLGTGTAADPAAGDRPPPAKANRFSPPRPEQLAPKFPQLEILGLLGQGGMGAVYQARQRQLDRLVALKILPAELNHDPAFAERFMREARALARLSHPNIVAVHDFGQADGFYYFLMEFVDGVTLRHLLAEGKLAPREALAIVPQVCEALQYAHDQGVVHRDIKPENILLDKAGRVKVADFGLARLVGTDSGSRRLTQPREVMGTPHYMAPEQVEKPQLVDHRADIYSLGVVFYEMLTGELPLGRFAAPSQKVQVDVRLDEVVLRALEKEPERRYQQASQVKSDVESVAGVVEKRSPHHQGLHRLKFFGIEQNRRKLRWTLLATGCFAAAIWFLMMPRKVKIVTEQFLREHLLAPMPPSSSQPITSPSAQSIILYDWQRLHDDGQLLGGTPVKLDGRTVLKIENTNDAPLLLSIFTIEKPAITSATYAVLGEIKYENVQGIGYLEMWNCFPPLSPGLPEGQYFSRTLGEAGSGPMGRISGTSSWRPFTLPFDRSGMTNRPTRLQINIFLPGRGVVWLGPPRLMP